MNLTGIHHVTAVSAQIRDNYRFYTQDLGMRLVKRSVNQDDTSAYHLFYADGQGSPGSDLTFFDWPVQRERRGTHAITRTFLRVAGEPALRWWEARLRAAGLWVAELEEHDGRLTLAFEDPEGQRLALVDDGASGAAFPWERSPVPAAHQIRGLGPVMLSVPDLAPTDLVLRQVLHMQAARAYQDGTGHAVRVYTMGAGGPAAELHVVIQPDLPATGAGAGGVHHVAFRVPTFDEHTEWAGQLKAQRIASSGIIDRYYFRSLYFREPNGILFELATDEPGFAVDEPQATLGEQIALPPFLEPKREAIVARLKPLD